MRRWRRSWFEPPRWRVELAVGLLVVLDLTALHVARGTDLGVLLINVLVPAGGLTGAADQRRRAHSAWRGLRATSSVTDAELGAAERAVREHTDPESEPVLRGAVRIADLRYDLDGGAVLVPVLLTCLTGVSVLVPVRQGGAWWAVPVAPAVITAVDWSRRRDFVRHRLRLRDAAARLPA